jgi:RNA binding exosome subunit
MAHRVQPGQQVRIVTVELAVAADEDLDRVADAVSAILSGAIEDQDTVLLDWRCC